MLLMWTGNLSVGVAGLDDEHKKMIRTINELHHAIEAVDENGEIDPDEIEIALHRLDNHAHYHFAHEEALMTEADFPGLEEHRKAHQEFIGIIAEMNARLRGSRESAHARELMHFMYDWAINHIHGMDQDYSAHLSSRGVPTGLANTKAGFRHPIRKKVVVEA